LSPKTQAICFAAIAIQNNAEGAEVDSHFVRKASAKWCKAIGSVTDATAI
jgi:hypothetical protein